MLAASITRVSPVARASHLQRHVRRIVREIAFPRGEKPGTKVLHDLLGRDDGLAENGHAGHGHLHALLNEPQDGVRLRQVLATWYPPASR
jgi:hypothetical protein